MSEEQWLQEAQARCDAYNRKSSSHYLRGVTAYYMTGLTHLNEAELELIRKMGTDLPRALAMAVAEKERADRAESRVRELEGQLEVAQRPANHRSWKLIAQVAQVNYSELQGIHNAIGRVLEKHGYTGETYAEAFAWLEKALERLDGLKGRLAVAKGALEFYANEDRYEVDIEWRDHGTAVIALLVDDDMRHDEGELAQKALAALTEAEAANDTGQEGSVE